MLKFVILLIALLYSVQALHHGSRISPVVELFNSKIAVSRENAAKEVKSPSKQSFVVRRRVRTLRHDCAPTSFWGEGMSQQDLMNKDECIVVDENDVIIGHDSKYNSHRFDQTNPNGILHRAFSVFLFNEDGNLLLQKRASDKITFPSVWTNTCCSHPLFGYTPSEVDDEASVKAGSLSGIKSAAIRKLKHELGIVSSQVSADKIKYLGRIHYCAADDSTDAPAAGSMEGTSDGVWGEHEIDYILFLKATVDVFPNPEEVGEWKYVNYKELKDMMNPSIPQGHGLRWSPWFRHIVDSLLIDWWRDLDATLTTDVCVDLENIHRF